VSLVPGLGIAKGMALTLRRFFEPKVTVMYPEDRRDPPHKFRGRLQLLYDEWGTLKCETCFQCAQACPIECIDMGGMDTRGRFHVHWGASETYGERREESALRRSGRTVPDPAYGRFAAIDIARLDAILEEYDHDPARMLEILEATQNAYGYLPVAALKRISQRTGAWYAMIYGTASYYGHLRFEPAEATLQADAMADRRPPEASYLAAFDASLAGSPKGRARAASRPPTSTTPGGPGAPARA
jgi:ferredoxin